MAKKFLIIINGPIGGGKTTVAKALWNKIPRTVLINLDEMKWLISDYKDKDLTIANKVGLVMMKEYIRHKINVIIDKAFPTYENARHFINLAKKSHLEVYQYSVEAPLPILIKRSQSRSLRRRKMPVSKIKKVYEIYKRNKYPVTIVFDSSKVTTSEMVEQILEDIKVKPKN